MGMLDFEDTYKEPFKPKPRKYPHGPRGDERLKELNNDGHEEVTEDFSDSPHLDY